MSAIVKRLFALLLIAIAWSAPVRAAYDQPDATPPPATAARLAVADGNVQVWRVDENDAGAWDEAQVNDVVGVGTGLFIGPDARAEVRWGPHALRLGADTRGGFSRIDFDDAVFNLEYGSANIGLRDGTQDRFSVTVAGMRVDFQAPGRYRVDAVSGQPLRITAFDGRATLHSAADTLTVTTGRALDVGPEGSSFAYVNAAPTALDEWALRRDSAPRTAVATRYVSTYMTGYEDLDANGDWASDATYGVVWYPRHVQVGWVPYRYGRWRWMAPWGWTWVDDAPWGFAPFHYGRWVVVGGRWCWWPGRMAVRPMFAPALVGWVGHPGWSVSVTVGGPAYVGWYPLAPWHAYRPHYTTNVTYITQINHIVIQAPPHGVATDLTLRTGNTVVPGTGFREPIRRVIAAPVPLPPRRELRPVEPPTPRTGFVPTPRIERGPEVRLPPASKFVPADPGRVPPPRVERGPEVQTPFAPAPAPAPKPGALDPGRVPTPRVERGPEVRMPPAPAPKLTPPETGRVPTPRIERGPAVQEPPRGPDARPLPAPPPRMTAPPAPPPPKLMPAQPPARAPVQPAPHVQPPPQVQPTPQGQPPRAPDAGFGKRPPRDGGEAGPSKLTGGERGAAMRTREPDAR